MDAFYMLAFEIQVTILGAIVLALITILQILDLRRARQKYHQELHALSCKEHSSAAPFSHDRSSLISKCSLVLQFIFGIIVFACFSWWTFQLVTTGSPGWAVLSGISALTAIIMPFIVWIDCKRKCKTLDKLISESRSKTVAEKAATTAVKTEPLSKPETAIEPVVSKATADQEAGPAAIPVPELKPVVAARPEPVAKVEKTTETAPVSSAVAADNLPEDSMLRRHYLTHLRSLAGTDTDIPTRPTDSMLRRHYDQLLQSSQQKAPAAAQIKAPEPSRSVAAGAPEAVAEITPAVKGTGKQEYSKKQTLPQDSILKRHFLAHLRSKIESCLPTRPTDSILKRHYDGLKELLVEIEMKKRLEEKGG